MKLKQPDQDRLIIESRQTRYLHVFLLLVLFVCYLFVRELVAGSSIWLPAAACLLASGVWFGFARLSCDTVAVIDTKASTFSFSSRNYFGVSEEFHCDLEDPFDVILEEQVDDSTVYRIGFVTSDGIKYVSKVFSSSNAIRKSFDTILQHLGTPTE